MSLVYVNGEFVPKLDAKLSVYDHGLLYGDGVWEGMRLFNGDVFRLADHVKRLLDAARAVALPLPFTADELAPTVRRAVAANGRRDGYVRLIVTRGPGTVGLDPRKCDPQVIVLVDDVVPFPAELYAHGLHAVTATSVRLDPANPLHRVRSLSHAHVVLAKADALRAGCLEAVLLTTGGFVAGVTEGHLYAAKNGVLLTPPAETAVPFDVADGVARGAAVGLDIPVVATDLRPADLAGADELFLAGTGAGVIAVVRLDGADIGAGTEGPLTRAVRERFRVLTRGAESAEFGMRSSE